MATAESDVIDVYPNGAEPPALDKPLAKELPESVPPVTRFTPNELRVLKAATGKTLTELQGDEIDMMQAMAWVSLYRLGHRVEWEVAGDVLIDMGERQADPTKRESSPDSRASAASGE
jgi:hypothetical protein